MAKDGHGQLLYLIDGSSIRAVETYTANQRMQVQNALWSVDGKRAFEALRGRDRSSGRKRRSVLADT
jgi:hypothetical protein